MLPLWATVTARQSIVATCPVSELHVKKNTEHLEMFKGAIVTD